MPLVWQHYLLSPMVFASVCSLGLISPRKWKSNGSNGDLRYVMSSSIGSRPLLIIDTDPRRLARNGSPCFEGCSKQTLRVLPNHAHCFRHSDSLCHFPVSGLPVLPVVIGADCFRHTSKSGTVTVYNPYLWPVVAIWVFDRFLRLVRLVYCNVHVRHNTLSTPSTISYDEDSNLIRLEVLAPSPKIKPAPGQYYYLYQPMTWRGWENHPFSLGAWTSPNSKQRQVSTDTMDTLVESDVYFEKDVDVEKDLEKGMIVQPYPSPSVSSEDLENVETMTVSFTTHFI